MVHKFSFVIATFTVVTVKQKLMQFPEAPKKVIIMRKVKKNDKKVGTDKVYVNGSIGPYSVDLNEKGFFKMFNEILWSVFD